MRKILVTDNPDAKENATKFARTVFTIAEAKKMDYENIESILVDGEHPEVFDKCKPETIMQYTDASIDFTASNSVIRKFLKEHVKEYVRPVKTQADEYITGENFPSDNFLQTPPPSFEDDFDGELPIEDQIAILQPLLEGKRIGAGSIAELTSQLTRLSKENGLFLCDKITGLFQSRFSHKPLITEFQAQTIFETHFCDKLAIRKISYKSDASTGETKQEINYKSVSRADLDLLWRNIKLSCKFNSRKIFYDSIPKWDGEVRIMSFMKDYFGCDANPNFFLLLMTSIIGKIVSPEKNYCPYFFDFVSPSKGIGKSLLCRRLLGNKYVGFLEMTSRKDDFFVNAYDGNNIMVVDDECNWCTGKGFNKITNDELKSLITTPVDKFSRKFQQPEEHYRSFIIVRTSNDVNQVYSTDERRQIIFQCKLDPRECRIKNLPDSFFEQMLAEAKEYYEAHGMYQLSDADWDDVMETNKENYNWETPENFTIISYCDSVREAPDAWGVKPVADKFNGFVWGNYKKYVEWCQENHKEKYMLQNRAFWRAIKALSDINEHNIVMLSDQKYDTQDGGHCRIFRIDSKNVQVVDPANIEDIPY
ncbi:MAG: virulence-associated E family protein [Alphaproteobacteria bacterium]|nr:virulence-associated E family protein [Alphaproteobacteria bacterium]